MSRPLASAISAIVGAPAEALAEAERGLLDRPDHVDHVDGKPDGPALVAEAPGDGLADPPRGIGGELEALAPVELLDGPDEAQVALLHQIEEVEAAARVALGDGDDQAQVAADELGLGLVGVVDGPVQLGPLVGGELRRCRRGGAAPCGPAPWRAPGVLRLRR